MLKYESDVLEEESYTVWYNPLSVEQTVHIHIDGALRRFHVPPKGKKQLASRYDYAIQRIDEKGKVLGGEAPQMINLTGPFRELNPVLDHAGLGAAHRLAEYERERQKSESRVEKTEKADKK